MDKRIQDQAQVYRAHGKRRSVWHRIVNTLTCIVVFCTTYALILPAITMQGEFSCGLEEHVHEMSCYANSESVTELICAPEGHAHADSCYDGSGNLDCGMADYQLHAHNGYCYDLNGGLICKLPEILEHVHGEECYTVTEVSVPTQASHVHDDTCYTTSFDYTTLICAVEETDGHTHTESCRGEAVLVCTVSEHQAHTHDENCYGEAVLSCGEEEAAGHAHAEACYAEGNLVCTMAEAKGHAHSDACMQRPLTCTEEETAGHTHGESCYEEPLICGQDEMEGHRHLDECYAEYTQLSCGLEEGQLVDTAVVQTEKTLTCQLDERKPHEHSDECYTDGSLHCGLLQLNTHIHTDSCVSVTEQEMDAYLICEEEEHIHTLICYADPNADLETPEIWEAAMADLELNGEAAADLLSVARSQLGYAESETNYIVLDDGITIRGYNRYGVWAGEPYAEWNQHFVVFCLHYANISEETFPRPASDETWAQTLADSGFFASEGYVPQPGDLLFLNIDDTDHVGIVSSINGDGYVTAILGDYHNEVRQDTFSFGDKNILGYARMPGLEASEEFTAEETSAAEETEAVNTDKNLSAVMTFELGDGMIREPAMSARTFSLVQTYSTDSSSGIDMTSMITSIKVYHKTTAWGDTWEEVGADGTIQSGDLVRFAIAYMLPAGTLSEENNSIYYQLPIDSISDAMSGTVYDSNGAAVGSFTISTSGLVTIVFNDNYVQENSGGVTIDGVINFDTTAEELDADKDGKIELEFTDNTSVEINIQQTVTNDLTVQKVAAVKDAETGLIEYEITVSSVNGTAADVTLTDWMGNVAYYSDFKVVSNKDGEITQFGGTPSQGSTNLALTLPQMEAGETYTITYVGSVINGNGHVTANNGVTVTSKDSENRTLTSTDSATVEYDYNILSKTGTVKGETVEWTLTIGNDALNLKGWTLSDVVNGTNLAQSVTITDSDGKTIYEGSLPYTFDTDLYGPISVTYTTNLDYKLGANNMTNTATLTNPDGNHSYSQTVNVQKPEDQGTWNPYNPLSKDSTGLSVSENEDGAATATIGWSYTINADKGSIYPDSTTGYWYFSDSLQNNQYFTTEQWDALVAAIQDAMIETFNAQDGEGTWTTDNIDDLYTIGPLVGGDGNYGFTVKVKKILNKGSQITFAYSSTGSIGDGNSQKYFQNSASVNNQVWDSGAAVYNPIVQKVDGSNGSESDTTHAYMDLENGIVSWQIHVYIPDADSLTGEVVITETLPTTVSLSSLAMRLPDNTAVTLTTGENSVTYGSVTGTVVVSEVDSSTNTFTITISQELAEALADQKLTFTVNTSLENPFEEFVIDTTQIERVNLTNAVSVAVEENNLGSDTHTQTITNQNTTKQLDKSAAINQGNKNLVDYKLDINPDAIDLDSSGDTITVEDRLSFWIYPNQYVIGATLVETSVKVSKVDSQGNKTEITDYSYTYTQSKNQPEWSTSEYQLLNDLVFTVPDNTHLVIEYQYYFTGKEGVATSISNTASIRSVSQNGQDTDGTYFTVNSSGAIADLGSVSIYKVAEGNFSTHLEGAEFELYKWNGTAWVFDQVVHSNGESSLKLENLTINQAYYLVEINAPNAYILDQTRHYFMIHDADTTTHPMNAPSDFPTSAYYTRGGKVYITNDTASTQVAVEKIWKDINGNVIEAPQEVTVQLMKVWNLYPGGVKPSGWGTTGATVNLTFGEYSYDSNVWTQAISAKVGDVITITLTTPNMSSQGHAGLMEISSSANKHLHYTLTDSYTYTFTYLVTGDANLRGWVYPENVNGSSVTYAVTPAANVALTKEPEVAGEVTLSGDNLTHTFTGLPCYDLYTSTEQAADKADTGIGRIQGYYTYYVVESAVPEGYEVKYSADGTHYSSTSPVVTNGKLYIQNAPEQEDDKISIMVDKKWVNQNGDATSAPADVSSVEFELFKLADTSESNDSDDSYEGGYTITVSAPNTSLSSWSGSYPAGTKLSISVIAPYDARYNMFLYIVNPWGKAADYKSETEVSLEDGTTAYKYIFEYTVGESSVELACYVNTISSFAVTVDATDLQKSTDNTENTESWQSLGTYTLAPDSWSRTITNLEPGTYKIVETTTGYASTATYTVNGVSGNSGEFTADGTFVITNTVEEEMTQVTVNKVWKASARANDVPESITFKLYQNGNPYDWDTTDDVEHTPYTLTPVDGVWSMTITDLPKYDSSGEAYVYTVKEVAVAGYYGRVSANQAADGTFLYTITNEPITEIGVEKEWANEDMEKTNVLVQLWRFESETPPEDNNTVGTYPAPDLENATYIDEATLGYDGSGKATWTKTFKNRPLYEYDDDGNITKYYSYVIVEADSGYYTTYSINGPVIDNDPRIIITNWPSTSVTVDKVWVDVNGNSYTPGSAETVTLKLMQAAGTTDSDSNETPAASEYASVTLPSSDGSWSHTFTKLPTIATDGTSTTYTYFVVEDGGSQYDVTYRQGDTDVNENTPVSGGTITVTNTVESKSITVNKTWLDVSGAEISPESTHITFKLYQNGNPYDADTTDDIAHTPYKITPVDGVWSLTIDDLPVTDANGVTCVYTVRDEAVYYTDSNGNVKDYSDYYTPEYSDLSNGIITIANTKTKADIGINKKWANDEMTKGPVTFYLYQFVSSAPPTTVNREENGAYSQSDVPNVSGMTPYRTITLCAEENNGTEITNASKTWKPLPLVGEDEEGNTVYYSYFAVEQDGGYIPSYSTATPVTGEVRIYVTNAAYYELPQTGSTGTTPYTAGGALLMLLAIALLMYNQKKGRKEDVFS